MISLFLILMMAASCRSSVVVNDHQITFDRRDQNASLDWPLPDLSDPGHLVLHGDHCFTVIQAPANTSDNMSVMHLQHCRNVVKQILDFFETNPSYQVNAWICTALKENRQSRSPKPPVEVYTGYANEPVDARQSKRNVIGEKTVIGGSQDVAYIRLASRNLGELLLKNYTDPQSINASEREYLSQFASKRATALGAAGVYCRVNGNIDAIRKALGK